MDYYKIGYDYFVKHKKDGNYFDLDREKWRTHYDKLYEGFYSAKNEHIEPYRLSFFKRLEEFEKKNSDMRINVGCGCCSGGYYVMIDGIEFQIYKDEEE